MPRLVSSDCICLEPLPKWPGAEGLRPRFVTYAETYKAVHAVAPSQSSRSSPPSALAPAITPAAPGPDPMRNALRSPVAPLFLVFLGILAFALWGCATTSATVSVPRAPEWQAPTDTRVFNFLQVAVEIQRLRPGIPVQFSDNAYTLVSRPWLDRYLAWTLAVAQATSTAYTHESLDCEDFTIGFYFFATRQAAKAGVQCSPLILRLVVEQPDRTRHLLAAVATDAGIFIVEPQPAAVRLIPLAEYQPRILAATLGDYNPR